MVLHPFDALIMAGVIKAMMTHSVAVSGFLFDEIVDRRSPRVGKRVPAGLRPVDHHRVEYLREGLHRGVLGIVMGRRPRTPHCLYHFRLPCLEKLFDFTESTGPCIGRWRGNKLHRRSLWVCQ